MSKIAEPSKSPRNPKCARCRNHGFIVQLKGHSGQCQFVQCRCWKCSLIAERTKIIALHRMIKKTNQEELAHSNLTRPRPENEEARGPLGGPEESVHLPGTSGDVSPGPVARSESVIKMPRGHINEADGRTYAELQVPSEMGQENPQKDGHGGGIWTGHEPRRTSTPDGGDHRGGPHFPSDYVVAEVGDRDMFSREVMAIPYHFTFYSRYPSGYAPCPAILVDMPLPPPGSFQDGHGPVGFPQVPTPGSSMLFPPELGLTHDGRMPFYAPHFPGSSIDPRGYLEELVRRRYPPAVPRGRARRAEGRLHGTHGLKGNSLEDDLDSLASSQNPV
ncbi:hypothetical protein DPEC_G00055660 [Dallia pectoralis]|uniref:Uncharacterized protein n=1 Tax=Dallia pectoralis TaxID=75939 RepID=A0ACC2H612_DALPE|nr:hypothetical protein DPEC_G00055660 [Dallia pectoralis]